MVTHFAYMAELISLYPLMSGSLEATSSSPMAKTKVDATTRLVLALQS